MLSVKPLDLTNAPTNEEIMAAGQLGGQLYPTHDIGDKNREKKINLSFGEAIDLWNQHEYKKAIKLFKDHIEQYPDSSWASEAALHMGCDAQYNGRYTEAEKHFRWILDRHKGQDHDGAKALTNKARLRLATLKVNQNNFKEAREQFALLAKEGTDWRDRTYASHWIQRLSRYTANQLSMLNCGTQAIAYLLEKDGRMEEARRVMEMLPQSEPGHSLKALSEIALQYGYQFSAVRVSDSELKGLPLPAIMHIQGKNEGDSGHYWVLKNVNDDTVELFDPQAGLRFEQTHEEFLKEWSGIALVFSDRENLPGIRVAEGEMDQLYGGCCGVPRPESQLGSSNRNQGQSSGNGNPCGSPAWSVNMVNMNLYVNDVPLWYSSQRGPSVNISISYNSQSAINQNEPFGNKWMFAYSSYLTVDTAGNVTIFMPDGRRDVYTKTTSGYNRPYQVFNTLTKIAENHFELKFPNNVVFVYNIPQGTPSQQPFLVAIRDTHNQSLTFGYNSNVKLTTITDALGRVTTLTYNGQGLVTLVTDPFNRTALFEYDANRNLTRITDMAGHSSTLTYNANVYLTSIENQRGRWEFYIEPADGVSGGGVYPAPGVVMWQNYRVTITNPVGDREEYYYQGDYGVNSWYVSPKHFIPYSPSYNNYTSAPKTYYYLTKISNNGEISKITPPAGGSVTFGYDTAGNRTSIQDGNGKTTTLTYDTKGNVTRITDPLGNAVQFTYDTNNHLTQLTDPAGRNSIYQYTGHDLTKAIDPKNGEVNFTYNSYGQLLTLQDQRGNSTSFAYDTPGKLISVTNPLSGQDSYTYDAIGRVATHTDPKNNTTSFVRDGLGRITQVTYQNQSTKTFSYDCCGLTTVADSNGTITFTYDALKRLSSLTDVYGKVISYGYDKNGNLTTLTYPDGKVVTYEYDNAGRLIKVTDWLNNITTYSYDGASNLIKTVYPNGAAIAYQYDNASRLKTIVDSKADGSLNAIFKYTLDQLGNRTAVSFNQPLNVKPTPPNANYTYDVDNRLLTANGVSFNYDSNGNLITKTSGGIITNYSWDFNDMLTQVVAGGNSYVYRYDGLGNRIARIENGVEKRYVGGLAETDSSGNITAYYVYGLGLISKITPSNQAYYYHYDGIGSTIGISDSTGNIVNKYAYDVFGKVLNQEEAIPNPFKYVGQFGVMDEGNGLLYMRARYYDPEVGRFISKDPIGFAGGDINLYAYVGNNPVNGIDPWGLIRAVFNAGGHIWIPPTAGSFGLNFSSEWWGLSYYKNEYKGMSKEFVIGSLWDVGVSAGISGLSGCENGTERTLAFGLGKYLGFQFTFKGDKLDAITAGWGRGWSLPVTFTIPWNEFLSKF